MKSHLELRKAFKDFWESKVHKEVHPIPLVPKEDPTTLFTGSGMQQLIPYLQGETHPLGKRLWNIQPCFRSQDIEEVGDTSHTTFFEMMGNWSLGDYFKQEQLPWVWEWFTKVVGLDEKKLYVTVFEGAEGVEKDNESFEIWKKIGVPEERIRFYGVKNNWWSRSGTPNDMPVGEIGGPDSEVFYDFGEELGLHEKSGIKEACHPNCSCGRFLEIGNSVFIQYRKEKDGKLHELPQKNVDYGGGLERLAAAVNNNPDVFQTDLYKKIVQQTIEQTKGTNINKEVRIISDHLKAAVFLAYNGVSPSNKEQGYVLRRLIRRSALKLHQLGTDKNVENAIRTIMQGVIDVYEGSELLKDITVVDIDVVLTEEAHKFLGVLSRGLRLIQKSQKIDGKFVFDLYQSEGFPMELTEEIVKSMGQSVNMNEVKDYFEKHKEVSRKSAQGRFKGGLADEGEQTVKYHTATHLIHQALFDVIGNVRQEGSNITSVRLRFDFFSEKRPSQEDIKKVEEIVNKKVKESLPVRFEIMPKEKAEEIGAKAFFKEKYGDKVKVYFVGDYSAEFCGGPHVTNSKEVGKVSIYKFEKIGSSLYRIYAR